MGKWVDGGANGYKCRQMGEGTVGKAGTGAVDAETGGEAAGWLEILMDDGWMHGRIWWQEALACG